MWTLKSLKSQGESYHLLTEKQYTIGRKDCDVVILNDPSISRKHATATVLYKENFIAQPEQRPELILKDQSKLGSVVNEDRFKGDERRVADGDNILFGTQGDSKFVAKYEPFVITTSCISGAQDKRAVRALAQRLGGHQVSDWRHNCSLLVMASLSVTVKVICALVSQKCIVTPQYLEDLIKSFEEKSAKPKCDNYLPPLAESQLDPSSVSFKPNPIRQSLLRGKKFIFLSGKQYKKLGMVIGLAGGEAVLQEESGDEAGLAAPGVCVMSNDAADATQMTQPAQDWNRRVLRCLRKNKKRAITDPEIGYAILYCSTDQHCNPDVNTGENVGKSPISQSLSQTLAEPSQQPEILAPNTEFNTTLNRTRNLSRPDITHIDDSEAPQVKEEPVTPRPAIRTIGAETTTAGSGRKRVREEDDVVEPQTKRPPMQEIKQEPLSQTMTKPTASRSSRTDSTATKFREPVSMEEHSEYHDDFDTIPSRPSRRERKKMEENKAATLAQEQIIDDFDSIPGRGRANKRERSDEINIRDTGKPSRANREMETTISNELNIGAKDTANDDNVDDFDQIPSRKRRQKDTLDESIKQETTLIDNFDDIPKRSRRRDTKPPAVPADNESDIPAASTLREHMPERKNPPVPTTETVSHVKKSRVKQEFRDCPDTAHSNLDRDAPSNPPAVGGFLCADSVNSKQVVLSEFSKIEGITESRLVVVKETDLVVRQPGQRSREVRNVGDNASMWKGKVVKNFKKFRKSARECEGLPTIIGGSDLVTHENKVREELEKWFQEESQNEAVLQRNDRMAQDLFECDGWAPSRKRRR